MENELTAEQEIKRRTRRSLLALGAGAVATVAGLAWLYPDPDSEDIPSPLRRVLNINERVVRGTIYDNSHLVKRFPAADAKPLRLNGKIGLDAPQDVAQWQLGIVTPGAKEASARVGMEQMRQLPRTEEIIDFRCIEGWSVVTQFAGAKFSDFMARFAPGAEKAAYVRMSTPDNQYYVGLDMPSALHPQTLLAWEMGGEPLTQEHGAPLRLSIPVKYGIKSIKRIGRIEFTDRRPADYWAEQGYDWFAGL